MVKEKEMLIKELLPLGSVVKLKNGTKKIMIIGIRQTDMVEDTSKEFDYLAVMYPEGYIGGEFKFLFNHEDIDEIYFEGHRCEERDTFLNNLETFYSKLNQFK